MFPGPISVKPMFPGPITVSNQCSQDRLQCQTNVPRADYSVKPMFPGPITVSNQCSQGRLQCQTNVPRTDYSVKPMFPGPITVSNQCSQDRLVSNQCSQDRLQCQTNVPRTDYSVKPNVRQTWSRTTYHYGHSCLVTAKLTIPHRGSNEGKQYRLLRSLVLTYYTHTHLHPRPPPHTHTRTHTHARARMHEWRFYAKASFRARAYSHNLFSPVMIITWWMKLGGNLPPGHDALLFSISGMVSCICRVTQTRTDIPRSSFTQSRTTGEVILLRHKADSNHRPVRPQSNTPTTRPWWPPQVGGSVIPRVLNGGINMTYIGCDIYTGWSHYKVQQAIIRQEWVPPEQWQTCTPTIYCDSLSAT